jgi:hypothetical protein
MFGEHLKFHRMFSPHFHRLFSTFLLHSHWPVAHSMKHCLGFRITGTTGRRRWRMQSSVSCTPRASYPRRPRDSGKCFLDIHLPIVLNIHLAYMVA